MVCEAYRQSMEYLKSYMKRQWSLVGGMVEMVDRESFSFRLAELFP